LKMVLTLKWFPMQLNFLELPSTYMLLTVPWYIISEKGQLLLEGFIMESTNSFGYSLSIRRRLMFLISLLNSFWSWHMTLTWLIKLWMTQSAWLVYLIWRWDRLSEIGTTPTDWANWGFTWRQRQNRLRNVVFKYKQDSILDKNRMMDNVQKHNIVLMYHCHKLLDLI
jgi:hypothetical protein